MSKKRRQREAVATTSPIPANERLEQLRQLFPDAVSEGKVDVEKLRAALGDVADDRPERYAFTWAGKRNAIRLLQTLSRATLVPVPGKSVHFDSTQNLFIEGDNLEVLKLLYKSYAGRVKMIYLDPPYNTGNEFIYPDNFADPLDTYLKLTAQKAENGDLLTSNPETSGRYHSAWLSMMYPRLFVARQLLRNDGWIFVSIDDHEVANLRMLMNEIFGEENFVTQIEWQKRYTRSNNTDGFTSVIDHILLYRRAEEAALRLFAREESADARYENPDDDPRGPWKSIPFLNPLSPKERPNLCYEIVNPNTGERIRPAKKAWRSSQEVFDRSAAENRVWWGRDGKSKVPAIKRFLSEVRQGMTPINFWDHEFAAHTDEANAEIKKLFGDKVFDTPKPTRLVQRMLELATEPQEQAIVLDFFAGSCTTAHAILKQNRQDGGDRQFIVVQIPECIPENTPGHQAGFRSIAELGRERIARVVKNFLDQDRGCVPLDAHGRQEDLGFRVFRLAESHIRRWPGTDDKDPKEWAQQMELFLDPLLPGWEVKNVICEVALKEGFSLSSRIERVLTEEVKTNSIYRVTDDDRQQTLLICLDDKLETATLTLLGLDKDDIFICRDRAIDDELAANLALQCRLKTL